MWTAKIIICSVTFNFILASPLFASWYDGGPDDRSTVWTGPASTKPREKRRRASTGSPLKRPGKGIVYEESIIVDIWEAEGSYPTRYGGYFAPLTSGIPEVNDEGGK